MVEQLRVGELPQSPEIRVKPPIPLKDLGIVHPFNKLGFENDTITVAKISRPLSADTLYLGLVDNHPFAGDHLGDLLNTPAPDKGDIQGIKADLIMPDQAKTGFLEDDSYLHRIHSNDPYIGPIYKDFVNHNLNRWNNAIRFSEEDFRFFKTTIINIIDSNKIGQDLVESLFKEPILSDNQKCYYNSPRAKQLFDLSCIAVYWNNGQPFYDFLNRNPEHHKFVDSENQRAIWEFKQSDPDADWKLELMKDFLSQLAKEELIDFAIEKDAFSKLPRELMIDPKKKLAGGLFPYSISFIDDVSFSIHDSHGNTMRFVVSQNREGTPDYRVAGYQFSVEYETAAMFPLLAWKNQDGKRNFVSQPEVEEYIPKLGTKQPKQADVYLGRVYSAVLLPEVTNKWASHMRLTQSDNPHKKQKMMGAQMPVWVSLPGYAKQLFSALNSLFPKLESWADL